MHNKPSHRETSEKNEFRLLRLILIFKKKKKKKHFRGFSLKVSVIIQGTLRECVMILFFFLPFKCQRKTQTKLNAAFNSHTH